MKKLINLIALVMLVSVNILAPFSYAQDALPEVNPENEVKTVEESLGEAGETSEVSEEIPEANSEEKGELEQGRVGDVAPKNILPNVQDDVETPAADETENVDTENNEEDQPEEETSENKIQDEEEKIEELEKVEKAVVMDIIPGTIVTLLPGTGFNSVIKTLANGGTKVPYTGVDNNIYSFERVDELPAGVTTGEISIAGAEYPVHAWFSGGVLYYTTQAETIQLNEDSQNMFQNFGALTELDLSDFDTRNVTNMYGIFAGLSKLEELNLSGWDFSNTSVNMMNMTFGGLPLLKKINMQNTKFSGSLASAFAGLNKVEELNLSGADTSNVMGMGGIFNGCTKLGKLNLNGWYFTGNLAGLFAGLSGLSEISLNGVDTKGVTNIGGMFSSCSSLTGLDLSNWDTSNVMSMGGMFGGCKNLKSLNLSGWNFEKINAVNFVGMLFGESSSAAVTRLKDLNLTNTKFSGSMERAFYYMLYLEKLVLDGVDTSRVTDMNGMFYDCKSLTGINMSSFDTSNVTNMSFMFEGCSKLENLDLSSFDTSNVTGMIQMFKYYNGTSLDLSNFDISNVTNMNAIFAGCRDLENLNLSGWDFRKQGNFRMYNLGFYGGDSLRKLNMTNAKFTGSLLRAFDDLNKLEEIKLDGVNTEGVTNMSYMFDDCRSLKNLDLSSFDTSKVTDMSYMFGGCSSLIGLDLSNFDTSKVTNMSNMFSSCSSIKNLNLDGRILTGGVGYFGMFGGTNSLEKLSAKNWIIPQKMQLTLGCESAQLCASGLEIDVSGWNLSNARDLSRLFANSNVKEIKGLDTWDTSTITGMNCMFLTCKLTGLDLSNWDTSNVTDMTAMFNSCSNLENLNLDNWSFAKNPKMGDMFGLDNNLKNISMKNWTIPEIFTNAIGCRTSRLCATGIESVDVSYWNLSQTKVLDGLFGDLKAKEVKGLNTWDTSNVTVMSELFSNCSNLIGLDLSTWDTSNVTTMGAMFSGCNSLTGLDLSNFDTSNAASMGNIFKDCSKLEDLNLSGWDFRNINNASLMMSLMGGTPQSLKKLNMTNTKYTGNATYVFGGLNKLEELNLDGADTSNVISMNAMFNGDSNLENLDLSSFDTSNVTSMGAMFYGCSKLEEINLSGRDFRNVSNNNLMMGITAGGIPSLTKLNMTNTKYTGNAAYAFGGLNKLEELNLNGADTSNVTSMNAMFNGDSNLKILDLGGLDTSNVKDMSAMFYNCSSLTGLDLSSWDTSNVTNMGAMFYQCSGLNELDLSNFDTSRVTTIGQMFYNTPNLKTIYASENFVITALSGDNSSKDMFSGTTSVIGGNGTKFDPNYIDEEYAKIDKVGQTGYFTDKNAITVKFINILDGTESISTFKKGQKLTPPSVNGYHVAGGYLDEEMKQAIDLNKGVDSYSVIYIKYERNGSSGGGGRGGSSKKTDEDIHGSAEESQKNTQDDKNTENVIQSDPEHSEWGSEESSNTPMDSSDKSSEGQEILSPSDSPSSAGQVSFTKEQKDAYTFAKENGITTKDTIQSAQMNGKLTRIAMAKMLSQYAINVLGKTPDASKIVKFNDVTSKKDADYDNGVTLAYQLGIMGQNMPGNNFRPNDEVSRAEFATALSRLLYQTTDGEYKSTKEYYIPHMAKLYNEGIISNTDPSMAERRGYVMIMLMRSAK